MTPPGTCIAAHRTEPDRARPALGGLLLCAGHYEGLVEALTGPSAADDPTLDAVWGVRERHIVTVYGLERRHADGAVAAAERLRTLARTRKEPPPWAFEPPGTVVCGDGETWHDPAHYRPGALVRDYLTLGTLLTGHVTAAAAHVSGTTDWRLPIADHVAELRSQIRHDLAVWARTHADQLAATPPAAADPAALSAYLARYTDWSAAQPWAADYVTVLNELRGRARAFIDLPQPRRVDVAACVERPAGIRCTGRLSTRLREDPSDPLLPIECDTCPASYSGEQWERLGKRIQADLARTTGRRAA